MDLTNTRILISHTTIAQVMGSTIVTAQLASCLKRKGAEVVVFASTFEGSLKEMFERDSIPVITDEEADLDLYSFDYVWVNSQVLPFAFVRALDSFNAASEQEQEERLPNLPRFIFNHMGAMEAVCDEYPYIPLLEESIASLEVYVSPEARDAMQPFYDEALNEGIPQAIFPNPAPSEFAFDRLVPAKRAHPQSVLCVSGHMPAEVGEALELLREQGLSVHHIGAGADEREVTPEVIQSFDAVITIGKTVQYCMLSATPVFVYDYLGGFGYLDAENIERARYANFSGREGVKMTAEEIVEALLDNYEAATVYFFSQREAWRKLYSLDERVDEVFALAQPREALSFPYLGYTKVLLQQERFAVRFWRTWAEYHTLFAWTEDSREMIDQLVSSVEDIKGSMSFKAGRAITSPARLVRDLLSRKPE